MEKGGKKILLLDGHSLAYRAFFALPESMTTADGQPTNAVYGFTSMLLKVLEEEKPDAVVAAFDGPRSELKRMEEFPEYKAHRPSMPDSLRPQMGMIEHLLEAMRIPVVRSTGFEADDVLGTLARRVADAGDSAVIVTGDRDALQLVGERVGVLMTGKGITETYPYDVAAVEDRYGVPPESIPDIAGLKGDTSDNIPGVPGIGEKGACALIQQYGSLENLYDHLGEIRGPRRKQSLEENREIAFLSRSLATIDTDVPVDVDMGILKLGDWDRQEVMNRLSDLEFRTLASRFLQMFGTRGCEEAGGTEPARLKEYSMVDASSAEAINAFLKELEGGGMASLAARVSGSGYCDYTLESIAIAGETSVLVGAGEEMKLVVDAVARLAEAGMEIVTHDGKALLEAVHRAGVGSVRSTFDTAIAAYLENPSLGSYHLWDVYEKNVGGSVCVEGTVESLSEQASLLEPFEEGATRLAAEAARTYHLRAPMAGKLTEYGMTALFEEVEMPLMGVLTDMEERGVCLDGGVIKALADEAGERIARLEEEIFEAAGREFNVCSPRQLGEVLFTDLRLPVIKKTKTGYSTDASVLEALRDEHSIVVKVLEHREYTKLKSTYFDVLPGLVCPETGRVHGTFNQTSTSTGRLSSSNPNLQNIPVRTDVGKRIRAGFVPPRGLKLLIADYSQIELRVLAHMSEDMLLLEAFENDEDIHRETAAEIFGVPHEEVTGEMRRMAKVVNFGVVYGMGYFGLSSRLGISLDDATRYIDAYFDKYKGVRSYRDRCIAETTGRGYIETLLGRRRYIPQLGSSSRQARELGERLAVNTPLQGTAADIIKKAMVDVENAIAEEGVSSRMVLQIHDELMLEVAPDEVEIMRELVNRSMSGVVKLKVPLKVDICVCDNWGEAKQ